MELGRFDTDRALSHAKERGEQAVDSLTGRTKGASSAVGGIALNAVMGLAGMTLGTAGRFINLGPKAPELPRDYYENLHFRGSNSVTPESQNK